MGNFVSMITGAYIPITGHVKGKTTMWIEYGFCFYDYWIISTQSKVSLNKKIQCILDVAFVCKVTVEYSLIRGLLKKKPQCRLDVALVTVITEEYSPIRVLI